jgi:hypothetical protein
MSDVTEALEAKLEELEAEKKVILKTRDAEIKVARDKYATSLKEVNGKIVKTGRMLKTSEKL